MGVVVYRYSFRTDEFLKEIFFFAGIEMASPVCGFLPLRSWQSFREKVPKLRMLTVSPAAQASLMSEKTCLKARSMAVFGMS